MKTELRYLSQKGAVSNSGVDELVDGDGKSLMLGWMS